MGDLHGDLHGKIFEALGKLDNIYRPQYREAAAILDDLIIENKTQKEANAELVNAIRGLADDMELSLAYMSDVSRAPMIEGIKYYRSIADANESP